MMFRLSTNQISYSSHERSDRRHLEVYCPIRERNRISPFMRKYEMGNNGVPNTELL